jgi:hypothetical protein
MGGDIPDDFGAVDQTAFVYVTRSGAPSNQVPVKFVSLKHTVPLKKEDVKVVHCSDSADYNHCNDVSWVDPNICCVLDTTGHANPNTTFATANGYHLTDDSAFGDSGVDVYFVQLAPGWTLDHMSFSFQQLNGGGSAGQPVGLIPGQTSATIFVPWSVGGNSGVDYDLEIYATGPINTQP